MGSISARGTPNEKNSRGTWRPTKLPTAVRQPELLRSNSPAQRGEAPWGGAESKRPTAP